MKDNKNNDFDFISSKFNEENITAPDSMNFDCIMGKGEAGSNKVVKLRPKRKLLRTALSFVACFAIIAGVVGSSNVYMNKKYFGTDDLISFSSYAEISALMLKMNPPVVNAASFFVPKTDEMQIVDESFASSDMTEASGFSYSQTNTQVASVDEADVVITDGKYIYYLNDFEIDIYSAKGKESKKVGEIKSYYAGYDEMYIYGDKLIAICGSDYRDYNEESECCSTVEIYDITDRANPVLKNQFSQSGGYTSSRMIGKYLYIVSSYYAGKRDIPFVCYGDNDVQKIPCDDIYSFPKPTNTSFVVMSAIDVESNENNQKTKAVLGCSSEVYCSKSNMYLMNEVYEWDRHNDGYTTKIIKTELDKLDFKFTGSAKVTGTVDSQYSLDEKDGYLRVATTDFNSNYLFILDENLKEVGSVKNFAQGESIQAVRYVDDYAYVITFEQTDPLFVISLKNPENPVITGSAKITGFSDNLIPVDDNTILGVGYGEDLERIKLALFDVTDKNNPVVLDSKEYPYVSPAQNNIKALLINKEAGYYAFAYDVQEVYNEATDSFVRMDGYDNYGGVLTFEIEDLKIKETNDFESRHAIYLRRCVYVGDYIYALTVDGEMQVYDMSE